MSSAGLRAASPSVARGLLDLVRPWRLRIALVALLVLGSAGLELAPPLIVRTLVDAHLTLGQADGLLPLALLYLAAAAGVQLITFLYSYVAASCAQGILSDLRVRLFAHLQRLPTSYFDRTDTGDVISRCTADIDTLDTVFSSDITTLLANLVRLATISVAMLALSLPLTLVAALVVPPLLAITRFLQVRVRAAERDNRIAVGLINARLQENLRSIEVVRAFGREPEFVAAFRQVLHRGLAATNRSTMFSAVYTPVTVLLSAVAVAALLWAGTQQAFTPFGISLGTLTSFLLLMQRFFTPITALGEEWQTVQGALAGAERIFGVLALPPGDRPVVTRTSANGKVEAPVRMDRVEFGYVEGHPVLHGVSLEVKAGEHVALAGRTGAGKTSALHILAGLYRPWSGSVLVAGRDPASLDEAERRQVLGVVPQVVQLFSGSVMENLTLNDASTSVDAVYDAARIAGADPFIKALPEGYDTRLSGGGGGAGNQLSAGQQQLLALARAMVSRPAVLLFDEATAAIDSASDAAFRAALRQSVLAEGCAVLTVSHRLSTALEADRIIVIEKGRIVEEGPPGALATSGGRFAALLELESAGWDWRSSP